MKASDLRARLNQCEPSNEGGSRQFVNYDKAALAQSDLKPRTREFLVTLGLPCLGGANLKFRCYQDEGLARWLSKLPHGFYPIGETDEEDLIAIESKTDHVWFFEGSLYKSSTRINQSVSSLAESLCIYEECQAETQCRCLERIRTFDLEAAKEGQYWFSYALGHALDKPKTSSEISTSRRFGIAFYALVLAIIFYLTWSNGCISGDQRFNRESWQEKPGIFDSTSFRKTMVTDLIDSRILIGLSQEQVQDLLGNEDFVVTKKDQVQLQYKLGPLSFAVDFDPDTFYLCVELEGEAVVRAHTFEGYAEPKKR